MLGSRVGQFDGRCCAAAAGLRQAGYELLMEAG